MQIPEARLDIHGHPPKEVGSCNPNPPLGHPKSLALVQECHKVALFATLRGSAGTQCEPASVCRCRGLAGEREGGEEVEGGGVVADIPGAEEAK